MHNIIAYIGKAAFFLKFSMHLTICILTTNKFGLAKRSSLIKACLYCPDIEEKELQGSACKTKIIPS